MAKTTLQRTERIVASQYRYLSPGEGPGFVTTVALPGDSVLVEFGFVGCGVGAILSTYSPVIVQTRAETMENMNSGVPLLDGSDVLIGDGVKSFYVRWAVGQPFTFVMPLWRRLGTGPWYGMLGMAVNAAGAQSVLFWFVVERMVVDPRGIGVVRKEGVDDADT